MHDCLARVGALATGTTLVDFMSFCAGYAPAPCKQPPYTEVHFYAYLLRHGFLCGYRLLPPTGDHFRLPESGELGFAAILKFEGEPALVVAESENPEWDHALYWDGSKIIDPADGSVHHPGGYKIKTWTPIHRLYDAGVVTR